MELSLLQKLKIKILSKKLCKAGKHQYSSVFKDDKQLRRHIALQLGTVSRLEEIFNESLNIMKQTTNPRTFFGRYDDALDTLHEMLNYSAHDKTQRSEIMQRIKKLEAEKEQLIISFIDRSIREGKKDILKNVMCTYENKMTPKSIEHLKSILN